MRRVRPRRVLLAFFAVAASLALVAAAAAHAAQAYAAGDKLATGKGHGAWLKPDGTLWTWGNNRRGQLGRPDEDGSRPSPVPGLRGVRDVACADYATVAVGADGSVWVFGSNEYGQLGSGDTRPGAEPVPVPGLDGVTAVAASGRGVLALRSDGSVWEWGDDSAGSRPRPVPGLSGVVAVARADGHGVALKQDGTVWLWGLYHGAGDLGNGCHGCAGEPVRVPGLDRVTAIAAGYQLTVALKADGTVWTLGSGESGQLGDGGRRTSGQPVAVRGLSGVTAVAAGNAHVLAVRQDGQLWAWGDNHYGQLGNPAIPTDAQDAGAGIRSLPVRCGKLANVTAVAASGGHSLALTARGELLGFGDNQHGALGTDPETLQQADAPMPIGQSAPGDCGILFACQTASGKYIRLCGEQDQRDPDLWRNITYRFGPANGPPELEVPSALAAGARTFAFAHAQDGADYQVSIRFSNGGYVYRVFSGSRSGAGVMVEDAHGKRLSTVRCIERPQLFAPYLRRSLPCDTGTPLGDAVCGERPARGRILP